MELPVTTPSPDHIEFDQICAQVDEFEPLPTVGDASHESEAQSEDESSLDGRILAALVTP